MKPQYLTRVILLAVVLGCAGCGGSPSRQLFDKAKWNAGRKSSPDLNVCPSMLQDLMANHLATGMTLGEVTNLLGPAEIQTPIPSGVRIRGESIAQTVYVYAPGMHNGWILQGSNSLILYFGHNDEYLRDWSPHSVRIKPVNATDSEAARDAKTNGTLHVGNLRFAGTPSQFRTLLGPPDHTATEHQLDYFLGKRTRLSWDGVFLELHFDSSNRLNRVSSSEH
jgi:hypothetical protein